MPKGSPGIPKSEEHKRKLHKPHLSMMGANNPTKRPDVRLKLRKPKSEETKIKMRKPKSEEHRKHIGDAQRGNKKPWQLGENNPTKRPEVRLKMSMTPNVSFRISTSEGSIESGCS